MISFFTADSQKARRSARRRASPGLTLIETLVASAIFAVFSLAIYQLYARVIVLSTNIRMRTIATELAGEQFELIRNLQYYDVGTIGGIPAGAIDPTQTATRNGATFSITTTIRNVDQPADGTLGGTPGDLSPADNKLVEIAVECTSCNQPAAVTYTSWIAPKSLETENGNGAIVIRAIDGNGVPVPDATVNIRNTALSPSVDITDTTDASGALTIVDAPPSAEHYEVTVSKSGYSTESTYPPGGAGNPNPVKPHLTAAANQVTQATFAIDRLSTFHITTADEWCTPIGNISGTFSGTKLIGTVPDVRKQSYSFTTDGSGAKTLSTVEWDTYALALSGTSYDLAGINPLQPVTVLPDTVQNISVILRTASPNALLAVVTDAASGLALAGASVQIQGGAVDRTEVTNIGSLTQTDWSGGAGQLSYDDATKFFSASGGVDYSTAPGSLKLATIGATYAASGSITSSTFDIGAGATFHQLSWFPSTQPLATGSTPVRLQIATSDTDDATTVWQFLGPDGTATTYYDTSLSDIADIHDAHRYIRYKLFLSTADPSVTPTVSDVSFTFTSGCLPPGQASFGGIPSGTYTVTASKDGYATVAKPITITADASITFSLSPS